MSWLIKVLFACAVFFTVTWSLILTGAQQSTSFPESLYSVAIIGAPASYVGETFLSALLAAVPTYLFFRVVVAISRDPSYIAEILASTFDISTGILGVEIKSSILRMDKGLKEADDTQNDVVHLDKNQLHELELKVVEAITEKNGYALISMIEQRFGKKAIEEAQTISLQESISQVHAELTEERRVVSSRSGINLLIGIVFAAAGISILVYTFFSVDTSSELNVVAIGFRVTLAISAQIFAYFFLALYRAGLSDVKFFRNEVTNLGLIKIGLLLAIQRGKPEDVSDISKRLVSTERNFILKKGETTASGVSQSDTMGDQAASLIEKGAEIARKVVADRPA
jgi:hypothetical protein